MLLTHWSCAVQNQVNKNASKNARAEKADRPMAHGLQGVHPECCSKRRAADTKQQCRLDPENMQQGWHICPETAHRWAMLAGGLWLHSASMTDLDLLRPGTLLNVTFLASALLMAHVKDASMVMEVVRPEGQVSVPVRWHRRAGGIAVGLKGCSPFCMNALVSDFSSCVVRPDPPPLCVWQ